MKNDPAGPRGEAPGRQQDSDHEAQRPGPELLRIQQRRGQVHFRGAGDSEVRWLTQDKWGVHGGFRDFCDRCKRWVEDMLGFPTWHELDTVVRKWGSTESYYRPLRWMVCTLKKWVGFYATFYRLMSASMKAILNWGRIYCRWTCSVKNVLGDFGSRFIEYESVWGVEGDGLVTCFLTNSFFWYLLEIGEIWWCFWGNVLTMYSTWFILAGWGMVTS